MNRKEAAKLLGISISSFKRRVRSGVYGSGVSSGEQLLPGQSTRTYSLKDLGLDDPPTGGVMPESPTAKASALSAPRIAPYEQPEPRFELDEIAPVVHPKPDDDFALAYREGRATDSAGNTITGENKKWLSGSVSLLGPVVFGPEPLPDTQQHMDQRLIEAQRSHAGGPTVSHAGSDDHPLNKLRGFEPKPVRPLPQQRQKQVRDAAILHRAFQIRGL